MSYPQIFYSKIWTLSPRVPTYIFRIYGYDDMHLVSFGPATLFLNVLRYAVVRIPPLPSLTLYVVCPIFHSHSVKHLLLDAPRIVLALGSVGALRQVVLVKESDGLGADLALVADLAPPGDGEHSKSRHCRHVFRPSPSDELRSIAVISSFSANVQGVPTPK